jgi:cytoskeletal protein CcmA (bactofilin family)
MFGNKKKAPGTGYKGNTYKDHSFIAPNTEVTGDISFTGGLHVEGKVNGNIVSEDGCLHVHGEVTGEIRVPHILVNGLVKGNVHCAEHLELAEKAHVIGNVYYKTMEMLLGAQINGSLLRSDTVHRIEHKPAEQPDNVQVLPTTAKANG